MKSLASSLLLGAALLSTAILTAEAAAEAAAEADALAPASRPSEPSQTGAQAPTPLPSDSSQSAAPRPRKKPPPKVRRVEIQGPPRFTSAELRWRDVQYSLAAPFMRSPARLERLRGLGGGCLIRMAQEHGGRRDHAPAFAPPPPQTDRSAAGFTPTDGHGCLVGGRVTPSLWLALASGRAAREAPSRLAASAAFMIMDRLVLATSHSFLYGRLRAESREAPRSWHLGLRWRGEAWEVGYSERRSVHRDATLYQDRAADVLLAWSPQRRLALELTFSDGLDAIEVAGWSGLERDPAAHSARTVAFGARWQYELATFHAAAVGSAPSAARRTSGAQVGLDLALLPIAGRIGTYFARRVSSGVHSDLATMQLTVGL